MKLTGLAGGSLVLGGGLAPAALAKGERKSNAGVAQLGHFVSIAADGHVTIVCQRAEMGQGIVTSVPQIIADEMGASWDHVSAVLGGADPKYGNQSTGGSASIRRYYEFTRSMGAVARDLLEEAAAQQWQVERAHVRAQDHAVVHLRSGRSLSFAQLAAKAARLELPDPKTLRLRNDRELTLTGADVKLQAHDDIVRGELLYAQDVQIPGMLIASIERPPTVGGRVKSFDDTQARKVKGVVDVIKLKDRDFPVMLNPLSGVAVVATNTWAAVEGRKKLKIEWELGPNAAHNSDSYLKELVNTARKKGVPIRTQGDVYAHQYDAARTVEATYTIPYHNHSPMETPAATAVIEKGVCTIWTGTQSPQRGKAMALAELGYDAETESDKVILHTTFMGGAFGRKGKDDFTIEAVELASATGQAVKVIWSREDDTRHGFYHSISANYYKAELSADGQHADNFISRVAHPAISALWDHTVEYPSPGSHSQSFGDLPFDIDNLSVEKTEVQTHLRIGWFRAVQNIHNAFAMSCFVDELAAKANMSTHQMWLNLIGKDRVLDHQQLGFDAWWNYGHAPGENMPDTARMKAVINELHAKAPIAQTLPENEGWGIGFCSSFASYSAAATRVRVVDGKLDVLEMHTVIDCGKVITPDRVRSQMEGAMIMGLAVALYSEITVTDGAIDQGNFDTYPVARMNQVPPLHVHLIDSNLPPGGVGEPGFPAIAPSIVNAVFHASGQRYRDLPLKKVMTV